jgi:alkylresorcinol/alkylpyrone synthase
VPAPHLLHTATALPPHVADQETLIAAFRGLWAKKHHNAARLDRLHRSVQVGSRHLALPIEAYEGLDFPKANEAWTRVATDLGAEVLQRAVEGAGLTVRDVDHLFFTTVTGLAVPSIDARIMNRLGMRADVRRSPLFGLGCAGGAAGLARASDALRAYPGEVSVLVSVELCSLTLQREDLSIANVIASGLFGDGAAAVVFGGGERRTNTGPAVVASRSTLYPDTERMMGWDIVPGGFQVILSAKVPDLVRTHLAADVDRFLAAQGLDRKALRHVICHSGGPKVLLAVEAGLELPEGALRRSWKSLEEVGNLSSASVLFVLDDLLSSGEAQAGDYGLVIAMGPGFGSELVLLKW